MDFAGIESHDRTVLLVHLHNLPEILSTKPYIVIDLVPESKCCTWSGPGDSGEFSLPHLLV
jgi:hypothetical protein